MRIQEICSSITDGSHNPPQGITDSEYLMLSSKNIFDNNITFVDPRYLRKEDFEMEDRRTNIQAGDVLLTIVGTVGRCAVVPERAPKFTLQRSVAVLHPREDICSSRFLMYALQGKRSYIEGRAKGVAQKGIYLGEVANIEVPIPDKSTQTTIILRLDKIASIIQNRQQQLSALDDLIKARFVEMFGESSSKTVPLKECCLDIRGGGTPAMQHPEYYGGNVPFIKSGDVRGDVVMSGALWLSDKALSETSAKYVPAGSVLVVNRSAALLKEFRAAIAGQPVVINQDIKAFVPKPEFTSEYLLWAIKIQTQYLLTKVTTVLTSHIDLKDLLDLRIVAASTEHQDAFSAFVAQIDKSKSAVQKSLDETQLLFDSLMQKYFG